MRKLVASLMVLMTSVVCFAQTGKELRFQSWALTPPMGWNSWDCYGPTVVEDEVKANADYMAKNLLSHGWEYVVVDIRWFVENDKAGGYNQTNPIYVYDEWGRYTPALNRFPSAANGQGFKPLADYCHERGLKFGIHLMRGLPKVAAQKKLPVKGTDGITCDMICNNDSACTWLRDNYKVDCTKAGAQEYYNSCFDMYADWGVDFVKIDDLARPYHTGEIQMIRKAIDQCGRPIVLSISPGETPLGEVQHVKTHANMWRTVDDFWDNWTMLNYQFGICAKWAPYIGPGTWPDADMLPLGKISIRGERGAERWSLFTEDEQYTLMNLWTIFKSPLMFGGDLPQNTDKINALLTNDEVLRMHHYSQNNRQISNENNNIVWSADNPATGDKYAALFNVGGSEFVVTEGVLWRSGTISYLTTGYATEVDVEIPEGSRELALIVTDGGDGFDCDHADWINPVVVLEDGSEVDMTSQTVLRSMVGWGNLGVNQSLEGGKLSVDGNKYDKGFAVHANSILLFDMPQGAKRFKAMTGIDNTGTDQGSKSSVEFMVYGFDPTVRRERTDQWNGGNVELLIDPSKQAATSGYISRPLGRQTSDVEADITGAEKLYLVVTNGGDNFNYDHADWINPVLIKADGTEVGLTDLLDWDADPVNGWNAPKKNRSNDNNPLKVAGEKYDKGIGCNSPSQITYTLPQGHDFVKFHSMVAYDDEVANANEGVTMEFRVYTVDPALDESGPVTLDLRAIGYAPDQPCRIKNMWTGEDLGIFHNSEFAPIFASHASGLYTVTATDRKDGASISIAVPQNIQEGEAFDVDLNITGPTEGAYVQILCDGKIVGAFALEGNSTVQYHCSGLEAGEHIFQGIYSGTTDTLYAVSEVASVSIETAGITQVKQERKLTVSPKDGAVLVKSKEQCQLEVYNLQGMLVMKALAQEGETEITLTPGCYIIAQQALVIR